jgi:hypothetical protein
MTMTASFDAKKSILRSRDIDRRERGRVRRDDLRRAIPRHCERQRDKSAFCNEFDDNVR